MHNLKNAALIVTGALLIGGCASKVPLAEKPPVVEAAPAPAAPATDPRAVQTVQATSVDPLNDPKGVLAKRSVYFDTDSYTVKDDYKSVVDNHSKYLGTSKRNILIQGNTDERGTSEYNLALGQKRAEAVRKAMLLSGAADAQIEAVSLGKEKPKAEGHDEAAWAENRRADIVYK
ncbi:MAG TPA: peptidoglycan-associated lipoprotein Pal [Burkholderiaceae bacterium]